MIGVFPNESADGLLFAPGSGQTFPLSERAMNKLVVGLLGVTALATTLVIVRQQRDPVDIKGPRAFQSDASAPQPVSLDRLRAVGF
ncbi:MAG: hypothetical protein WD101_01815 [Gemmatimonadota bacterium]